jgi:hypothetical protein
MTTTEGLAGALLRRALEVLPHLPAEDRPEAWQALDAFTEAPGPVRFLAAWRVLGACRRRQGLHRVLAQGAASSFDQGLSALGQVPGFNPAILQTLRALPVDPKTGRRLEALAALMGAHAELASRAQAAREALRAQFAARNPRVAARKRR